MKKIHMGTLAAVIALAVFGAAACDNGGGGEPKVWIDPATQTTQLTGGTVLVPEHGGNNSLPGSPYGYEIFFYPGGGGTMTWYGAKQGGGGAFKASWTGYYLARLGYFWGNGGNYTKYKNIYVDYNFKRSAHNTSDFGFIGLYGWFRSPTATVPVEKLIEYYIVDDWLADGQLGAPYGIYTKSDIIARGETLGPHLGPYTENGDNVTFGAELGSFEADGATYKIYMSTRIKEGCIDNPPTYEGTFMQLFSVRQGRRTHGTISVTEHFNEWSKYVKLDDLYEVKFKVETMGGNGYLDLTYLYLSQESKPRE